MSSETTLEARPCPADEQLLAFLENVAPPPIAEHVEKCGACLARLERLAQPSTRVLDVARLAEAVLESEGEPAPHHPDYEVLGDQPVAQGGMGVLWLVRDRRHNRRLAMKVLASRWVTSADMRARFRDETVLACQLMHTGLIPIYDDGFLPHPDERPFYVMRFIRSATNESAPGETLEARLPQGPCPPAQLVALLETVRDVARTLGYLHLHEVIHRDVKPQNILLGPQQEAFLLDLGLAKKLDSPGDSPREKLGRGTVVTPRQGDLLRTQSSHGTPGYMPPEQARNETANISLQSDVFSLGVILVRILTGHGVFEGTDSRTILGNTLAGNTREAIARVRSCSADPALISLALQCIEVEPTARPKDGNAVAQSLTNFLASLEAKRRQAFVRRAVLRTTTIAALVVMAVSLAAAMGLWGLNQTLSTTNVKLDQAVKQAEANERTAKKNEQTANTNAKIADDNRQLAEARKGELLVSRSGAEVAAGNFQTLFIAPERNKANNSDGTLFAKARQSFLRGAAGLRELQADPFVVNLGMAGLNQLAPPPESSLKLPQAAVLHISLSPDERWALVSFAGGDLELYDLQSGARIELERKHLDVVWSHAFSPDGRLFASGGGDGRVVIWDLATKSARFESDAHVRDVTALAFTPDSQRVVSADGALGLRQGELLQTSSPKLGAGNGFIAMIRLGSVQPGRIRPNNPSRLVITSATRGEQVASLARPGYSAISLAVSPDSQLALCGTDGGVVEYYDLENLQLKRSVPLPIGGIQEIGFASLAQAWLMGNAGLSVLDIESGKHRGAVDKVAPEGAGVQMRGALSSDCRYAIATHRDGTARLYDIPRSDRTLTFVGQGDGTRLGPIAAGRQSVVLTADGFLWRYPLASRFAGVALVGADDDVEHWSFCQNRPWIAGSSNDGRVTIWDQDTGEILLQVHSGTAQTRSNAVITADGKYLIAAADDQVRIWTVDADAQVTATRNIATSLTGIRLLAVDPQTARVAAGDELGGVNLIDLEQARISESIAALPNQKDKGFRLGIVSPNLAPITPESTGADPVFGLSFSPDGKLLFIDSVQARIWDTTAQQLQTTLQADDSAQEEGSDFAFSLDGSQLLSRRTGDSVQLEYLIWNVATGKVERTFGTTTVGAKPLLGKLVGGGQQLFTAGSNGKLSVYDLANQEELLRVTLGPSQLRAAVADDKCRRLLLQTQAGPARVFHLDAAEWTGGIPADQVDALQTRLLEGTRLPTMDPMVAKPRLHSPSAEAAAKESGAVRAFAVPGNDCKLTNDGNTLWISGAEHTMFELSLDEPVKTRMLPGLSGGPLPGWPKRGLILGRLDDQSIMLLRDERLSQKLIHTFKLETHLQLKVWSTGQQSDRLAAGFNDGSVIAWSVNEDRGLETGRYALPAEAREAAMSLTPEKADWIAKLRRSGQPIGFPVETLVVSPTGQLIVTGHSTLDRGSMAGVLAVYDMDAKNMLGWQALAGGSVTAVSLLEGDRVAAGQWNGALSLLQIDFGGLKTEQTWPAHEGTIRAVIGTADGTRLISAGNDRTAKIWDCATTDKPLRVLPHPAAVLDLALSEDERQLVTVCADGFVRVFNME